MGLWRQICEEWQFNRHCETGGGALAPLRRPGFWLMATHRYGQWATNVRVPVLGQLLRGIYFYTKFWVGSLTGVDIMVRAKIGKRFHIHTCHAIVIANGVVIGDDCAINSGACIVHSANSKGEGTPVLGRWVRVGVGAKILGPVTIGDFSIIGANAVVTKDVPSCSSAVGVPAKMRSAPRAYVEEYYNPKLYWPRRAGLLPDETPPELSHLS